MRRLRLLIVAPCLDGEDVGEAWSSFQWASHLSARHEVTVLTYRKRGRPSSVPQLPLARVVEWTDLPWVGRWERFNSMCKPGYLGFARRAAAWIRARRAAGESFDVGHQFAPIAMRYSSPLLEAGCPYVLGPLAGSLSDPTGFERELGGMPWYTRLRALDALRLRWDPRLRRTYTEASLVLGVAPYVRQLLEPLPLRGFDVECETGIREWPTDAGNRRPGGPLRLLYVGRITRAKGVIHAVRALGQAANVPSATLTVAGDGEDLERCRREAALLGLGERVTFLGRVPPSTVSELYRGADLFVFPSLREPSGNVVLEAMSQGVPVLSFANGGPAQVVDGTSGVLVEATGPRDLEARLAREIERLAGRLELLRTLGLGARERVLEVGSWPRKIARLEARYARIVAA